MSRAHVQLLLWKAAAEQPPAVWIVVILEGSSGRFQPPWRAFSCCSSRASHSRGQPCPPLQMWGLRPSSLPASPTPMSQLPRESHLALETYVSAAGLHPLGFNSYTLANSASFQELLGGVIQGERGKAERLYGLQCKLPLLREATCPDSEISGCFANQKMAVMGLDVIVLHWYYLG